MHEVHVTEELLLKILSSASDKAILIGGQALYIWAEHYDINYTFARFVGSISDDVDFLGSRADVEAIAQKTSGRLRFTPQKFISALVGQVTIPLNSNEYVNVDVLHKVVGIDADEIRKRASVVTVGESQFLIMHPLDVLKSRVENLALLDEKQNVEGIDQTRIALLVANEFIKEISRTQNEKNTLKQIEAVAAIGTSTAGKKVTRDFGINFLEAIPASVISLPQFHEKRWPRLHADLQPPAIQNTALEVDNSHPEHLAAEKWAAENNLMMQTLNTQSGQYRGEIVFKSDNLVLQSIGKNRGVIHPVKELPQQPEVGQAVVIRYKDGRPQLEMVRKKVLGRER